MKLVTKIKYWVYIVYLSVKWIFKTNLGDEVIFNDRKYIVVNGVRSESWRLSNLHNGDEGWVLRVHCKKIKSLKNTLHSFSSGYRFYMTSWYGIWCNSGILPWMRRSKIW